MTARVATCRCARKRTNLVACALLVSVSLPSRCCDGEIGPKSPLKCKSILRHQHANCHRRSPGHRTNTMVIENMPVDSLRTAQSRVSAQAARVVAIVVLSGCGGPVKPRASVEHV